VVQISPFQHRVCLYGKSASTYKLSILYGLYKQLKKRAALNGGAGEQALISAFVSGPDFSRAEELAPKDIFYFSPPHRHG
jgi:hypothetical protein